MKLHASHQGIDRTKRRARQTVYWPGINNDIETTVAACQKCSLFKPSQTKETYKMNDETPEWVFQDVAADFFQFAGKNFLVYVDRLSGWPIITAFKSHTGSKELIRTFRSHFSDVGVPQRIRTDNGTQFTSFAVKKFMEKFGVEHTFSSPHYPQSGLAESAVKRVKYLIAKTTKDGNLDSDEFHEGLLEMRNTHRRSGYSPAEIVFGQNLNSLLLAIREPSRRNGSL